MSDVNQQTVSLANGTLSPDLRVNYVFGLVLGVNEFRQEQEYFLEKDYIYNRELHGYGTASGLKVSAGRPTANDPEVQITVGAGMAIDQWGRPIVVRNDLCARLGAWLAKWQRDHSDDPLTKHLDDKGNASLYVVASHDECEDVLVPIPGQPCSSSQTTQAPSRIRDSYNIDFRWNPPEMPAWNIVRCFAKLMSLVRIVPELPQELSDEGKIIAQVRQLNQPCPDFATVTDRTTHVFRLPAETAREALDRIFTVWTTEVRPKQSNLLNPKANGKASEAAILLARLDFKPQISGEGNTTTVTFEKDAEVVVNDEGRPYLLHTQLMQELLLLGSEGRETEREFATLSDVLNQLLNLSTQPLVTITPATTWQEVPSFELWFHLNPDAETNKVFIQDTPVVKVFAEQSGDNDATLAMDCPVVRTGQRNVFSVKPNLDAWKKAGQPSYLRFVFPLDEQKVAVDPKKTVSLREYSTQGPIKFEGYNGKDAIIVYVRVPHPAQ
jgi:hypothetical protein